MNGIAEWWDSATEDDRQAVEGLVHDGDYPGDPVIRSLLAADVQLLQVVTNSANVYTYGPDVADFFAVSADSVRFWRDSGVRARDIRANQWLKLEGFGGVNDSYWLRITNIQEMRENEPWDHRVMLFALVNESAPVFIKAPQDWRFTVVDDPLDEMVFGSRPPL